ncbi:ribosome biogenesis factor YjgA [Halotalea alkalilenta]|uniref:ribosome biogenesis factor YjgA n=1 Tax=Halotalea alkalilenta TaxID=376489 RepID=UPI000481C037|nr:ribosome biogenesis factor YjgA [Halotalea alkalilenta]
MARPPKHGTEEDVSLDEAAPSKSSRKREMTALQKLGAEIIELSPALRGRLPLSDDMLAAIEEMGRIKAHEARRRHMQYVGKLMRSEDLAGIEAAFAAIEDEKQARDLAFHELEGLRDRLIEEGDQALDEVLARFPSIELSSLRQLVRNARRERAADKPPASARKLFKLLRDASGR